MSEEKEALCTVTFPDYVTVAAPRQRKTKTQTTGGHALEPTGGPVALEGVPMAKAMKFARTVDATVTDPEGNVISAPKVKITDNRAEEASRVAKELAAENAGLKAKLAATEGRLDRLEAALAGKQDRRGPKPKG